MGAEQAPGMAAAQRRHASQVQGARRDREDTSYQVTRLVRFGWRHRWATVPAVAASGPWALVAAEVGRQQAGGAPPTGAAFGVSAAVTVMAAGWAGRARLSKRAWARRRRRWLELAMRHRFEDSCRDLGIMPSQGRVFSKQGPPKLKTQKRGIPRPERVRPVVLAEGGTVDATIHLPLRLEEGQVVTSEGTLRPVLARSLYLPGKLGQPEYTQVWPREMNGIAWWNLRAEYRRAPASLDWGFRPAPDDFTLRMGAGPGGENHVDLLASPHIRVYGPPRALALDTPIATPTGWTTMGDVQVGDAVFDDLGQPVTVVGTSEVFIDRPCYEVEFDDGSTLVADGQHQWLTWTRDSRLGDKRAATRRKRHNRPPRVSRRRPGAHPPRVRTTAEIASTLVIEGKNNHSIPVTLPLNMPETALPIDPYVLGVWLGDGLSNSARFVGIDPEIADYIRDAGYEVGERPHHGRASAWAITRRTPWLEAIENAVALVSDGMCLRHAARRCGITDTVLLRHCGARTATWSCRDASGRAGPGVHDCVHRSSHGYPPRVYRDDGFHRELTAANLIRNKHIPAAYLRASSKQRLALLQGIMDTDGTCSPAGRAELGLSNLPLLEQARELVISLGHKPTRIRVRSTRLGGPAYRFAWSQPDPIFRLPRKADRLREKTAGVKPFVSTHRYIRDVRPVDSVPVRCITVDAPSHLFLAGESMIPTHNSGKGQTGMSALAQGAMRGWLLLVVNCSGAPEWNDWQDAGLPNVRVIRCSLRNPIPGAVAITQAMDQLLEVAELRDRLCTTHHVHAWAQLPPEVRLLHPRVLCVIDEPSALLKTAGAPGKKAGGMIEMVVRTGPKYGITVMTLDQIINVTNAAVTGPTLEVMRYVVWMGDQPDAATRNRIGGFVAWPTQPPRKGGAAVMNFGAPKSSRQVRMPYHSPAQLQAFLRRQRALWP